MPLRCRDTGLGFLLESVQDVNRVVETDRVNCPPGIAAKSRNDFYDAMATKSSENLSRGIRVAALSRKQGLSDMEANPLRERTNVFSRRTDPLTGFNNST